MTEGLSRAGFDLDLKVGESREDAFARMANLGKVEHKRDFECIKTGNVFIEYSQYGRPSGLRVTTAEHWAIEYHENCWLVIPTALLREIARKLSREKTKDGKYRWRRIGGDHNKFRGIVIPLEMLIRPWRIV